MEEELNIFNDKGSSEKKEDGRKSEAIKDEDRSEDEEDDDDEDSVDGEGGKDLKEKAAKIKDAKKNKPKRKINIFRFKPDMLTNQDRGIKCLYENISKARIFNEGSSSVKKEGDTQRESSVRFDEFKALDKLVSYYKEWHFHFMPKYDFKFFLDRCSFFGKNNLMKTYMSNVRRIHKGEINWSDLLQDVDIDQNKDTENQNNADNPVSQQAGQQNNSSLKVENRTISKQIKDTYLPNNTLNKSTAYNSSQLNHSNAFQTQSQETNPKNTISKNNNNSKAQVNQDNEEYQDEMQRILNYEEELRILEEENLLAGVDQNESHPQNYYEEDDYRIDDQEDIQLKKIQKQE